MEHNRAMRVLIAGVAVAAVWWTLWLLGRVHPSSQASAPFTPRASVAERGRAPLVLSRGYLCPPGWPYAAYAVRAHHFYPPNHPFFPDHRIRPDRCYAAPAEAGAAGYSMALPPRGGMVIDGVYLAVVDLDRQCVGAARHLGFGVPCPARLPNPGPGSGSARCGDPVSFGRYTRPACVYDRAFLFDQAGFAVPPGHESAFGGSHLVITAFRQARPGAARYFLECPEARRGGPSHVRENGSRVEVLVCGEGPPPLGGHVILRWSQSGVVYQVGIKGDTPANRRLLEAVAANVRIVGPPSGSGGP